MAASVEETIPPGRRNGPPEGLPLASKRPLTPKRPVGHPKKKIEETSEEAVLLREDDTLLEEPSPERGKYTLYTPKEKTAILEEVELCGIMATTRKWKIAPSTIATWKRELIKL